MSISNTFENLRYWESATTYRQACEDLAALLGDAAGISSKTSVLGGRLFEHCSISAKLKQRIFGLLQILDVGMVTSLSFGRPSMGQDK